MKKDMLKEFNEELDYIIKTSYNGNLDTKTLTNFNQDRDCFNRYIDMQSNAAEKAGFKGIADKMRKQKL